MMHYPSFYGSSVTLSGHFPSVLSRPDGSFNAGMSAFAIVKADIIIIIIIIIIVVAVVVKNEFD